MLPDNEQNFVSDQRRNSLLCCQGGPRYAEVKFAIVTHVGELGYIGESYGGIKRFCADDVVGNLIQNIGQLIGKWISEWVRVAAVLFFLLTPIELSIHAFMREQGSSNLLLLLLYLFREILFAVIIATVI